MAGPEIDGTLPGQDIETDNEEEDSTTTPAEDVAVFMFRNRLPYSFQKEGTLTLQFLATELLHCHLKVYLGTKIPY